MNVILTTLINDVFALLVGCPPAYTIPCNGNNTQQRKRRRSSYCGDGELDGVGLVHDDDGNTNVVKGSPSSSSSPPPPSSSSSSNNNKKNTNRNNSNKNPQNLQEKKYLSDVTILQYKPCWSIQLYFRSIVKEIMD